MKIASNQQDSVVSPMSSVRGMIIICSGFAAMLAWGGAIFILNSIPSMMGNLLVVIFIPAILTLITVMLIVAAVVKRRGKRTDKKVGS